MRIPPVGTPVTYYPHAEADNPPVAAIVIDINKSGVATLRLFFGNGGDSVKKSVHHVSSGFLRDEYGKLTPGAHAGGAWDFHPWFPDSIHNVLGDLDGMNVDDSEDGVNLSKSTTKATAVEKRAACLKYFEQGFDVATVAKKVRSLGLTQGDVQKLYETEVLATSTSP